MNKPSIFVLALALGTGAGMALAHGPQSLAAPGRVVSTAVVADPASNAAFRDGLYQAKLALDRGSEAHIASGRWATEGDRAWFAAGYRQGYFQAR
jgi:hypothetical protein